MKRWHGIAAGVIAYVLFLVVTAPAAKVLPLLKPLLPTVQLQGVDGSLWSGSAARVAAGALQLQAVHWQFRPLALLGGRSELALQGQLQGRELQGRVGRRWFGSPYLADVQGVVPAQDVLNWLQVPQVGVQGHLTFDLDEVRWTDARMPVVAGALGWAPATVSRPMEIAFGTARLETVTGDEGRSLGKLTTSDSALLIEADLVLEPGGAYRLDAAIRQNGDVPPAVANFLSTFAEYRDGTYHFEWSASL